MNLLLTKVSLHFSDVLRLKYKYLEQYNFLVHTQPVFHPQNERPIFALI